MKKITLLFLLPVTALAVTSCNKQEAKLGYSRFDKPTMVCSDLDNSYAPSLRDVKMLVVPISFVGDTTSGYTNKIDTWSDEAISKMEGYYFSESNSLKAYYDTASFGQLNITGKVTDIYENSTISISSILADNDNMEPLFDLIENAVNWVIDNDTEINWSEYDLNQDGCIDNIHLITNYHSTDWNTNLWPHMYWTNRKGTLERPLANVYSISCLAYVSSYITATHEQGHIFGLEDYYDYSHQEWGIDYVGCLDMQSNNVFDWNSYSKYSMGWVSPYVINGEKDSVTITMSAASINGDCLLIPANYDSWNGSAFDEYFLIELFAPYGNNAKDWKSYQSRLGSNSGLRVYHVDSRVYGSNTQVETNNNLLVVDDMDEQIINCKEDVSKWVYITKGANNCVDWDAYEGGIEQLKDHPLLSIVQKGGTFTFAQPSGRHVLSSSDLFKKGNTFTFDKYSCFLNKQAEKQELTDKGEEFPYEFTVDELSQDSVTITVNKVK